MTENIRRYTLNRVRLEVRELPFDRKDVACFVVDGSRQILSLEDLERLSEICSQALDFARPRTTAAEIYRKAQRDYAYALAGEAFYSGRAEDEQKALEALTNARAVLAELGVTDLEAPPPEPEPDYLRYEGDAEGGSLAGSSLGELDD